MLGSSMEYGSMGFNQSLYKGNIATQNGLSKWINSFEDENKSQMPLAQLFTQKIASSEQTSALSQ
jgi:hypothetical protein